MKVTIGVSKNYDLPIHQSVGIPPSDITFLSLQDTKNSDVIMYLGEDFICKVDYRELQKAVNALQI